MSQSFEQVREYENKGRTVLGQFTYNYPKYVELSCYSDTRRCVVMNQQALVNVCVEWLQKNETVLSDMDEILFYVINMADAEAAFGLIYSFQENDESSNPLGILISDIEILE